MAVSLGQAVIGTATAPAATLCPLPPGPCTVTITVGTAASAATLYIGTANTVTTSTGTPVVTNAPLTIVVPGGSAGTTLFAVASAASTPVGILTVAPDRGA